MRPAAWARLPAAVRLLGSIAAVSYGLGVLAVAIVAGFVVGTFGVLPFAVLPRGRRERYTIYAAVAWSRVVLWALQVRLRVSGDPGLHPGQGALVICNHQSWLDPVLLMATTRSNGLSKSEILWIPVIGVYGWLAGTVFFDRKSQDGRSKARSEVLRLTLAGNRIQVFPEGTRTRHVRPREQVYLRLIVDCFSRGIPVIPCAVVGSDQVLPTDRLGAFPGQTVWLDLGEAMLPSNYRTSTTFAAACWEDVRLRHSALMQRSGATPQEAPATTSRRSRRSLQDP